MTPTVTKDLPQTLFSDFVKSFIVSKV